MKFYHFPYLVLLLSLVLCTSLSAQSGKPYLKLQPPIDGAYSNFSEYLKCDEENIYIVGNAGKKGFNLKKHDQKGFREHYEVLVPKKLDSRYSDYKGMIAHHGRVDAFYQDFDKKTQKLKLLVRTVDAHGSISEPKAICEIESDKKGRGGFHFSFSKDHEKISVYKIFPFHELEDQRLGMAVYDKDFNLLWESDYELPYADDHFSLRLINVTNTGEVIALGDYEYEKVSRVKYKHRLSLFKFTSDGFKELGIELSDMSLYEAKINTDILPGKTLFYSWFSNGDKEGMDGMAILTIDNGTFEYTNRSVEKFSEEFYESVTPDEIRMGSPKIIVNFTFKELKPKPDGGAYIIAEKYYEKVYTIEASNGSKSNTYEYFDLDLLVLSFDKEGEVDFVKIVPKFQKTKSGNDTYNKSSFASLIGDDGVLHLFFNDNPENQTFEPGKERPELMKKPEKSVLIHYIVDIDGSGNYNIMKTNSKDFIPEFRRCMSFSNSEILMVGESGRNKIRYGTISLR